MKKLLLILALTRSLNGMAQGNDLMKTPAEKQAQEDSSSFNLVKSYDSLIQTLPAYDSITMSKNMERNISGLLELQNTRRTREKRNAIIRIGIGVAFLIVLLIGLRRKSVKK